MPALVELGVEHPMGAGGRVCIEETFQQNRSGPCSANGQNISVGNTPVKMAVIEKP